MVTREFLLAIPKTDLHVHLDGSLRLSTLIELAKKDGIELPSYTEEGLKQEVFKSSYDSLVDYLKGFAYTTAVMQSRENIRRIAYEFALDNGAEGVRYVEVRFAPQLHINAEMDIEAVLTSVNEGMLAAKQKINNEKKNGVPDFEYGIIVCGLRYFNSNLSYYYERLLDLFSYAKGDAVYGLASLELVRAAVDIRDKTNIPIVGIDLAGAEAGFPAIDHVAAYNYAHKHFLKKTVHAGEAYGAESIFQAITSLHADRIGHGYMLFEADAVRDESIKNRQRYVSDLAEFIADRRITIEVCLTSNLQTNPELKSLEQHSFKEMMARHISVSLCTDNRLISRTTVTNEIEMAWNNFDLDYDSLKNMIIYGFKRSFFPGTYSQKRDFVRSMIEYYDSVAKKFGIG